MTPDLRRVFLFCAAIAIFIGGLVAGDLVRKSEPAKSATPPDIDFENWAQGRPPLWADPLLLSCRQPNADEQHGNQLALKILEFYTRDWLNPLEQAAIKHFSYPSRQLLSRAFPATDTSLPCPAAALYPAITAAVLEAGVFDRPFLWEDEISLARQLGPRDPRILDAVARSAFYSSIIPSDPLKTDLRPYARLALAELGPTPDWTKKAVAEISADSRMGTGAAQVAVAGGDQDALPVVNRLMQKLLSQSAAPKAVPWTTRNRLYELAYALGFAGSKAQPYAAPLAELLDRHVQSFAGEFGMLELPPRRMCFVANHIGGQIAEAASAKDFCVHREPLEQ